MNGLLALLVIAGADDVETRHYSIRAETLDQEDVGRMLEALHGQLAKHFGAAPKGRLRVEVYSTRARWKEALRDDGITPPEAGGYYSPNTKKAYLFVQPSDYFTRQLILHEATHQFHYLAATGNKNPETGWYTEGLAEYFGMHNWDGTTLKTGVVPAITLEDYPAAALRNFDALKQDLEGLIAGRVSSKRPEAWALVHFLMNKHPKHFRALAAKLDRRADPLKTWKAICGPVTKKLVGQYRDWMLRHQQPWKIVWTAWQEHGDAIEGRSRTNGIAVLKKAPQTLTAELERVGRDYKAGLVFGFHSAEDFHLLQVLAEGTYRVTHFKDGSWKELEKAKRPEAEERDVLSVERTKDGVLLKVNGETVGTYDVEGDVGLNVEDCRIRFRIR